MNFNELIVREKIEKWPSIWLCRVLQPNPRTWTSMPHSPRSLLCCSVWPWELTLEKEQEIFDSMSLNLNSPSATLPSLLLPPNFVIHVFIRITGFSLTDLRFFLSYFFFFCLFSSWLCVSLFLCSKLILTLFLELDNVTFTFRQDWNK